LGDAALSTDSVLPVEEAADQPRPTQRRSSRAPGWWEEHKSDVVKGILIAVAGTAVLAVGRELFCLNREVGEIRQGQAKADEQLRDLRERTARVEDRHERLQEGIDKRIDERISRETRLSQGAAEQQRQVHEASAK